MKAIPTFELFSLLGEGMAKKMHEIYVKERVDHPEIYVPAGLFNLSVGMHRQVVLDYQRSLGLPSRINTRKRKLEDLLAMQAHFKTLPGIRHPKRAGKTKAVVIGVLNQKGGAGKTSTALNLGHALALRGYRILLIDADAQASLTTQHGIIPDDEIADGETLFSAYMPEREGALALSKLPQQTHWRNIDLIPSNLYLSSISEDVLREALIKQIYTGHNLVIPPDEIGSEIPPILRIKRMIETIQTEAMTPYDIIIIDTPPSIGTDAYNYLEASDMLLIPVPPDRADISSTSSFFRILKEYYLSRYDDNDIEYCDISMLLTKMPPSGKRPGTESRQANAQILRDYFQERVLNNHITESVSLANAAEAGMSVIEMNHSSFRQVKSCAKTSREYLAVAAELNEKILAAWDKQIEQGVEKCQ